MQKSKSEIQNIVNDFDTAKAMLKNVENIVEEIKKQTNMEPVKEQAAIGDDVKSSLSPSDSVNTANVPDLRLPESVGSTSEVTDKKRPESILDRILKKKLHGKDKLGQPKLKPDKLGDEKVGSQPIERVIWDKQMDPRMFQHASQRKGKDKLRLGSPRTDDIVTSEVEENGTPSGLNHDFPAKFPGQKVTVRGKEIPLKQKTTMEMSPHAGTEDAVGDVPSKLKPEEKDSTSTYQEALDLGKAPSQVAVDDAYLETNDKNPEKMDSRLKNIDALGSSKDPSQIIAGSASKYYDDISEGMDNKLRNNEPFGLRKTSFHKIADTASKYDNIPEGIDSRSSNKEPLGLNKIPSQETVGDVFPVNNDNSPKEMHSGLKDIDTLSQNKDLWQAVVGSASKYNDNIREEMDSRSRINEALGSSKALAPPRPDEFPVVGNALEESRWSSSLGTLMPVKPDHSSAPVSPKDMYFVGTGIKLPLQMIRNDNGTVHLSVDLDKLCSCKNNTVCPKNHTAVEETVGTALEKQINAENNLDNADFGNVPVGMSLQNPKEESQKISSPSTTRRNERGTRSKWLDMKNSIARQLDPIEQDIQREDINIFKRSTEKNAVNETPPEKISVPIAETTHVDKEHEENSIPKNSLLHHVESNSDGDTLDTFQEFLHKKLMTLKTKMMDTERKNELKLHQSEEKFMDTLNAINRKVIPSTRTNEIEDIMARGAKEKLEDKMETMDLNKSLGSMKPIALKSRFMEDPSSKERGNELFDIVIPIKGANKQKKVENLQNNLENLNEYIDRYSTEKKIKQKETDSLQKTNKNSFIKKEVDIVGNVLRFLKSLATDEK